MTEKICINGKDAWIVIEPHAVRELGDDNPTEYFTASYHLEDPASTPGGVLFAEEDKTAKRFESPVEALEFASEKLLAVL